MIPFYEPLSANPPLLCWNLNTSQTKELKRRSDWSGARYIRIILWLFWKMTLLKMAIFEWLDFEAALMFPPRLSRLPERKDICSSMMPKRNHLQGLYYLSKRNFVEWLKKARRRGFPCYLAFGVFLHWSFTSTSFFFASKCKRKQTS